MLASNTHLPPELMACPTTPAFSEPLIGLAHVQLLICFLIRIRLPILSGEGSLTHLTPFKPCLGPLHSSSLGQVPLKPQTPLTISSRLLKQAVIQHLKHPLQRPSLRLASQSSICLLFLSAGIKGGCHRAQLGLFVLR